MGEGLRGCTWSFCGNFGILCICFDKSKKVNTVTIIDPVDADLLHVCEMPSLSRLQRIIKQKYYAYMVSAAVQGCMLGEYFIP